MADVSVVVRLHFSDGDIFMPFFFHDTLIGGVPLYVHSSINGLPFSTLKSFSFFTNLAGSKINKIVVYVKDRP